MYTSLIDTVEYILIRINPMKPLESFQFWKKLLVCFFCVFFLSNYDFFYLRLTRSVLETDTFQKVANQWLTNG